MRFTSRLMLATSFMLVAANADAATIRYLGKIWSNFVPGTLQMRSVLYQTNATDWSGTSHCRRINGTGRCLFRTASIHIHFQPGNRFSGDLGGGACTASGSGNPTAALSGTYNCYNGDRGGFYFRRLGR